MKNIKLCQKFTKDLDEKSSEETVSTVASSYMNFFQLWILFLCFPDSFHQDERLIQKFGPKVVKIKRNNQKESKKLSQRDPKLGVSRILTNDMTRLLGKMEDFYLDLVIDILFGPDLGAGRL